MNLGRDHPQGSGHLQHTPCDVIFSALVPVDMSLCPYILFTSHGVHKHPPPPPSKIPERILQGVKGVIQQMHDPSLTTNKQLASAWWSVSNWFYSTISSQSSA